MRIPSPETRLKNYPGQFSGGMRLRIMIAMAIACSPKLIIADEPTTALDMTIQAQILSLMESIREESQMSIMLITYDLGVVAEFAERVIVMYAGQIIEEASTQELFSQPAYPYILGLLNSLPKMDNPEDTLCAIEGSVQSLKNMPSGCRFHNHCTNAMHICPRQEQIMKQLGKNHYRACHLYTPRG